MISVKKKYIFLIYLYSLAAHIALVFAAASFAAGVKNSITSDETADLLKASRAPLAFKVSLIGRRGNSYDESKIDAAVKFDEIKKLISRNLPRVVEKNIEPPPVRESVKKSTAAAITPVINPAFVEKSEKAVEKKINKAPVEEIKKKSGRDSVRKAVPKAVSNVSKKAAVERKKIEKNMAGNSDFYSDSSQLNKTSDAASAGGGNVNSPGDSPGAEVFGNFSGGEKSGSRLAGTPDGQADPALELKSIDIFKAIVGEKIRSNIKYPYNCRRFGIEGTVRVKFEIVSSGRLASVKVAESSNNSDIDESAMAAVKKSEPFLPYPDSVSKNSITFVLPLNYRLNE
jgi:TonB family protein